MDDSLTVCDEHYCIEVFNTSNIPINPNTCGYRISISNIDTTFHLNTFAICIISSLSALLLILITLLIIALCTSKKRPKHFVPSISKSHSKTETSTIHSVSRLRTTEKSANYQYAAIPGIIGGADTDEEKLIDRAFDTKTTVNVQLPLKSRGSQRFLSIEPIKVPSTTNTTNTTKTTIRADSNEYSEYLPVDIKTARAWDSSFHLRDMKLESKLTDRSQDDMMYLNLTRDDTQHTHTDTGTITPITADEFTRISTWRVIKLFTPQQIKYCDIDFSNETFLGKGSMGKVFRAKYDGIDVAVKRLNMKYLNLTGLDMKNFKREAAIMQKVGGHKHIARMYGFCTDPEICIVTEYYSRGSLHDIIKKYPLNYLRIHLKIQMMIEASLGVLHLHQQNVIHRDISARNLLVDENWTVVVADLGMSRMKGMKKVQGKSVFGPVKWMAPESITKQEYSEKTDSYSFGITLFEVLSECEPYKGMSPIKAGAKVVHEGLRPQIDELNYVRSFPDLGELMKMLWKHFPRDRPDFLDIGERLKCIKSQVLQH